MSVDVSKYNYPAFLLSIKDGMVLPPPTSEKELLKRTDFDLWIEPDDPEFAPSKATNAKVLLVGTGRKTFDKLENAPEKGYVKRIPRAQLGAGAVLCVITREGRYAKLYVEKLAPKSIRLKYIYQPNGSRRLK